MATRVDPIGRHRQYLPAAATGLLPGWGEGVIVAWREFAEKIEEAGRRIAEGWSAGFDTHLVRQLIEEDCYRQYAALYNLNHPHKKISWRRLNRPQRARALELFATYSQPR